MPGWRDLKWPGRRFANIDHLVIGPGGIFVIDSEIWSGSITAKDGVLRHNGRRREQAVPGCADSAIAVRELVPRYLDHDTEARRGGTHAATDRAAQLATPVRLLVPDSPLRPKLRQG